MADLNSLVDDDTIETAIDRHDDPDHPEATTVEEVREVLDALQSSAEHLWGEYMDAVEEGNATVLRDAGDVLVLDTGEHNYVSIELSENADLEDSRELNSVVTDIMHQLADRHVDRSWGVSYPLVVAKPVGVGNGQLLVECIMNSLVDRGLSPGQAWHYYGVVVRDESRNRWAARCGYGDHSSVSEAVRKAESKLP